MRGPWSALLKSVWVVRLRRGGPCGGVVVEGCEVVFVEYFDLSFGDVDGCYGDVLVDFFDFGELWFGCEVAEEYAVHDKLSVGGAVAEVASECEVALAGLGVVVVEALVDPVPDGSSDEEVGAFDCVPVVDEVAEGVAHGVGVFGDVEGVVEFHFAFYGFVDPCDGGYWLEPMSTMSLLRSYCTGRVVSKALMAL